ncbi:MAG TPA: N-acetylmuramoyl-L-alanine amidase [Flavitalea sp.]|nr:N-acetylmuramoyl-L-alanine amidase [Flavitalea sp.]
MRYLSLPVLEQKVLRSGNDGEYLLKKIAVPVPGEALTVHGYLCTPANRARYYHASEYPKKRIVLHYTAGQIRSDLSALTRNDYHVSVPFVIARDGTIYQLFSSKFWSGHIGKGLGNENTGNAQDKCTIGIELSNYGFLYKRDGNLETYYSRQQSNSPVDIYCSINEAEAFEKLATPFRGESYYATFTEPQYDSLIILVRYLTRQYNIRKMFLPEEIRYQTTDKVLEFNGIVSHINYRKDGKWDIGPAFNWKKVISAITAPLYIPVVNRDSITRGTGIKKTEKVIRSEEEIEQFLPEAIDASEEDLPYNN